MSPHFQPMPLLKRAAPFDDPNWIFELKYDGYRSLAIIENGRAQLLSRNGHPFASFAELGKQIAVALPNVRAVIDGEICKVSVYAQFTAKTARFAKLASMHSSLRSR